ncbi:MAG: ribonuclease E activity regulator RraA [Alphaproteobacteria bacterium]|nr:ribonuclease E activity regulator RraA [Alphaproteobacteria bacterium]
MPPVPTVPTADLSDAHADVIGYLEPLFRHYGGARCFGGPIRTVKCFEDNTVVREALEQPGDGSVLVVDGGGSLRCALVGGNLATLAHRNGWAGILVFGCVRDAVELIEAPVGVMALGTHPRKSWKRGEGEVDLEVGFAGVTLEPGAWLYADDDGVIVAPHRLDA